MTGVKSRQFVAHTELVKFMNTSEVATLITVGFDPNSNVWIIIYQSS